MRRLTVPLAPRRLRVTMTCLVVGVVFVASIVDPPSTGTPPRLLGLPLDKWLHGVAYAGVAASVGYAALGDTRLSTRALLAVFCLAAGYGLAIELVQAPLPARAFALTDAAANTVGALVGTLPFRWLRGRPWQPPT